MLQEQSKEQHLLEKVYEELTTVRHLLEILLRSYLKKDIESIVTTMERQKVYTSIDGFSSTGDIAQKAGVTQRAVQIIIKDLMDAGLITMERRGRPRRIFDYIPQEWRVNDVKGQ
jgi:DNA-binding transcriptional ArsR family regulator